MQQNAKFLLKLLANIGWPATKLPNTLIYKNRNYMNIQEITLRRTIPVVINSYNQLTYLKNIVNNFLNNGFCNIYIIDQGSSYPPLCEFLSSVTKIHPQVFVINTDANNGPRWFIEQSVYHMFATEVFLYSDPDIIIDDFSDDFVLRMITLSHKYQIAKVGVALSLSNLNNSFSVMYGKTYSITEWESQFWTKEIETHVYAAPVDTTLHLFNKQYYSPDSFFKAIRVAGPGFEVKHAPWLVNDPMPQEEKEYYAAAKNGWGCWTSRPEPEKHRSDSIHSK
jgi:hypothetical protein